MTTATGNADILRNFMADVWDAGDVEAVDRYLAEEYTIFSDPGDPWDGQTLSRERFTDRLLASRGPFPDLRFEITEVISEGDRVAISWEMRGTQSGPMGERPPSSRAIRAQGMTIYYFVEGRIAGHRQVVDRLTVGRQLGLTA